MFEIKLSAQIERKLNDLIGRIQNNTATKDEIKSAFRQMARKWHPDINKAPEAEAKFKELGKAYETLMDDEKRATYDRFGIHSSH